MSGKWRKSGPRQPTYPLLHLSCKYTIHPVVQFAKTKQVLHLFFFFLFFLGSKSIRGLSKILAINISTYSMCSTTCKWKIEGGEGGRSRGERERKRERAVLILLRQIESWTLHPCRACQSPSSPSSLSSSRERKGGRSRGEGGGRNGS